MNVNKFLPYGNDTVKTIKEEETLGKPVNPISSIKLWNKIDIYSNLRLRGRVHRHTSDGPLPLPVNYRI